jgi:hypothetical protein
VHGVERDNFGEDYLEILRVRKKSADLQDDKKAVGKNKFGGSYQPTG